MVTSPKDTDELRSALIGQLDWLRDEGMGLKGRLVNVLARILGGGRAQEQASIKALLGGLAETDQIFLSELENELPDFNTVENNRSQPHWRTKTITEILETLSQARQALCKKLSKRPASAWLFLDAGDKKEASLYTIVQNYVQKDVTVLRKVGQLVMESYIPHR